MLQRIVAGGCEVKLDVKLAARCTDVVRVLAHACQRPALDLRSHPLEPLASPGQNKVWDLSGVGVETEAAGAQSPAYMLACPRAH